MDPQTPASPSLSVITPAYNVERYLPRCIESVLGQTWQDLELVVVDDGSTDRTADVISDYAAQDSRVRGFRGRNRGVSYARNVAMKHARGRYFGFIDGDDEWEPTFASTLIGVLAREPQVAVVTGNALNAGGGALDGRPVRPWPATARNLGFLDMIEHEDAVFIMSIFRREVYEAIGGSMKPCTGARTTNSGCAQRPPGSRSGPIPSPSPGTVAEQTARPQIRRACSRGS